MNGVGNGRCTSTLMIERTSIERDIYDDDEDANMDDDDDNDDDAMMIMTMTTPPVPS